MTTTIQLHESLLLKACRREKTVRPPIWLMRQAGRYMKSYRELRAKVPFLELCHNSDLCAEVTVNAAHELGVDAAIIFSDLLLLVEPLGFKLSYGVDQGPQISNPVRSQSDVRFLSPEEVVEAMGDVFLAIKKTRKALNPEIPLLGFAGAPFTMAAYLIEGKTSRNFLLTKKLMHTDPILWNGLCETLVTATAIYLNEQIKSGAQAVQIFDSWVGCLSPEDYEEFVLPHTRRLVSLVKGAPLINFATQTGSFLESYKKSGGDVIGVDWRVNLAEAWKVLGSSVGIMGNLDPALLLTTPQQIKKEASRILKSVQGKPGFIFNLGHGILPETPYENVCALIEFVKTAS